MKFLEKGGILENYNLLWLFSDKRTVKKHQKRYFSSYCLTFGEKKEKLLKWIFLAIKRVQKRLNFKFFKVKRWAHKCFNAPNSHTTIWQIITNTPNEKYIKIITRNVGYLDIMKILQKSHHFIQHENIM